MPPDYYQLLHVMADAPAPVIKASYRAMMQKLRHHPDLGGDPARAQQLNEAVDILCNPAKRALYDSELKAFSIHSDQSAAQEAARRSGERAARQARSHTSRASDNPSSPGGKPCGPDTSKTAPEEPEHPETQPQAGSAAAQTSLPTRPHCLFCKANFSPDPRVQHRYTSGDQCVQCTAPTTLLEQLGSSTTEELRRIYRHEHDAPVRLWTQWPMESHSEARLQDLSLAGCAIESDRNLAANAMVLIDTDALKAICEVRYCKPAAGSNHFSIGLAFKTLKIKARPGSVFSIVA